MDEKKLETLSFQEILKKTDTVFEAVNILGQRMRQINARRAAETAVLQEEVLEDEYAITPAVDEEEIKKVPKSIVQAMDDFFSDRLKWRYADREESEEGEDSELELPEL